MDFNIGDQVRITGTEEAGSGTIIGRALPPSDRGVSAVENDAEFVLSWFLILLDGSGKEIEVPNDRLELI